MGERADILFLCASPTNADSLELDREARTIQRSIEDVNPGGDAPLKVVTRWAAEPLDLLREIRSLRPTVLHFAGYGARGENPGIYLQAPDSGEAQLVSDQALGATIAAAGSSIRVIVLNACYTEQLAAGLLETVDCVIGVSAAIGEIGARAFAREFYCALAEGCSVQDAWKRGITAPEVQGTSERCRPQLRVRSGIEALRVVRGTLKIQAH